MRTFMLAVTATPFLSCLALHAQLLTNPVQDYINKTTLLNNILSNARATAMSQKAQTGGRAPNGPANSATPDPTIFTVAQGGFLLPRQLASKGAGGQQAEQYLSTLITLYEQTARKDGFPPHDLAYALEYFLVNTYMTYHDLHDVDYKKDPRVKRGKDMFERLTHQREEDTQGFALSGTCSLSAVQDCTLRQTCGYWDD